MFIQQSTAGSRADILPGNPIPAAKQSVDLRRAVSVLMLALTVILSLGGMSKASAATSGVAVTSVNLRAGPSTQYPVVRVMPQSASLVIYGCSGDRTWCDVSWAGARGWVSASYIYVNYNGQQTVLTSSIVPVIGIATVAFSVAYWDSHYHSQPWYGHWDRYYHGGSRKAVAGCGPNGCGAAAVTHGPNGGARAAAGGCNDGNCGGAAVTRGPNGGGRAAVGGCGPEKCGGASVTRGPLGNTRVRHGSFDRP